MAASKKSTAKKSTAAKKTTKSSARKTASTKAPAKKTTAKKTAAKKTAAKKTAAKKSTARKAPARKPAAKKVPAEKTAVKTTTAKKTVSKARAKTTTAKKTTARKAPATRAPARKAVTPSILSNEPTGGFELPKPRGTTKDGVSYTKDFDVKFLKAQRDELERRRAAELARATRLEDEATSLIEDGEMGDVQFDDEGGEGDTMVVQRDLDRVLSSQARQTIAEIDAALDRIRQGTYGYSEVSGTPIPRERLEAIPETTVLAAEKVSGIGRS
jgi:RNA polymerase-binding transcription factor DksA